MSTRTSLLKRFDELIKFGTELWDYDVADLEFLAKKERWQTSCLHIMEKTFGKDSIYYTKLRKVFGLGNRKAHVTHGTALMEGAKEEIEKGFLYKIERLVSIDIFDSIVEQTRYLLKSGFKDVAAILGRVVIENTLKDLAKRENISFSDKIKLSALNQLLWKNDVYAKNVWRVTQGYIDLGNDAAHGDFDKYDDKSVKNMLTWIEETLLTL